MKRYNFTGGLFLVLLVILFSGCFSKKPPVNEWIKIEPGLLLGMYKTDLKDKSTDSDILILKIDPAYYDIDIYCASQFGQSPRSFRAWAGEFELLAAINAGMYATDLSTSIGYLKSGDHYNNPVINRGYKSIFACQPGDSRTDPVRLIDLTCEEYESFGKQYTSFLQSIRMISCEQKNVWEPQDEKWNVAALGTDFSGHLLLIYSTTLFSVHDLTNQLLALPISIKNAMYLEGGFPAGLYLSSEYTKRIFGNLGKPYSFNNDDSQDSRTIPNIIGIKRRPSDQ